MVQLVELPLWIEEEEPPLPVAMPRVYRQPRRPPFRRGQASLPAILHQARQAHLASDRPAFGIADSQLVSEFQPAIQWALSSWDYLLSMEGCRFLPRSESEKLYCRGDYRVFGERDFNRLVHETFKERLVVYLEGNPPLRFEEHLRQTFWPAVSGHYRALQDPPDPRQRRLTGWSYLRCVPYEFLNPYHHDRVYGAVKRLAPPLRQAVDLYHLRFYREEAALTEAGITLLALRRRLTLALKAISSADYLSYVLLKQIERY